MRGVRRRVVVATTVGVVLVALIGVLGALLAPGERAGTGSSTAAPAPEIAPAVPGRGAADEARSAGAPAASPPTVGAPDTVGRDLVRTAQLTIQVADPTAATRGIRTTVAAAGGVVAEEQVGSDGAWLVLRVPVAGLDRLVDDLSATGTVLTRSARTEDATEQVVDLDSRVATQQASVTRVRALLAQATSIGDVVAVESELASREADLDSLQRRLAALKDQVALSTLTVELRTAPAPRPSTSTPGFGAGLTAGWAGLKVIGSGLATAAGFLLPFLPVLVVAGAAVWVVRRRRVRRWRGGPGPEGGV